MRPYCTLRDPFEQAKLWRQSRTSEQIAKQCAYLRSVDAPRIAACIESVGPRNGPKVTNAVPGYGWHQYGEAVDCVLIVDGEMVWTAEAPGYLTYAVEAKGLDLRAGRDFGDNPHVQLRHHEPHHEWSPAQIDVQMAERFPKFAALK
jgi:hypothetical protein